MRSSNNIRLKTITTIDQAVNSTRINTKANSMHKEESAVSKLRPRWLQLQLAGISDSISAIETYTYWLEQWNIWQIAGIGRWACGEVYLSPYNILLSCLDIISHNHICKNTHYIANETLRHGHRTSVSWSLQSIYDNAKLYPWKQRTISMGF